MVEGAAFVSRTESQWTNWSVEVSSPECVGPSLQVSRYPQKLSREEFYPVAYLFMTLSRRLEERFLGLYHQGQVKGTVTLGIGNEATTVGAAMPFRPGKDIVSLLHRDFSAHLLLGATPYQLACQYLANAESPTHGREGNVHHGDAANRRFPMISHLGKMLSLVVGGTWAARQHGEEVFGLAAIGDGGTSTGEFHESLNLASVLRAPVLFLVENNHYAFSTPTSAQYHCQRLSDRAVGYGITGRTIDGTDPWIVYQAVLDSLDAMRNDSLPVLLECMSVRLLGHAAYDKATYVAPADRERWLARDPLPKTRKRLADVCMLTEKNIVALEDEAEEEAHQAVSRALRAARPEPPLHGWQVYSTIGPRNVAPFSAKKVKMGDAVHHALEYILAANPQAFLAGMDVGTYGSAFKTCRGLVERFGPERVIDMPICESAITGFALGASQVGGDPIVEFQFADFSTEAVSQLGLNAATWYFRSGREAPMLIRLPCGGGLTMGAFHSGEFEGLWSRFPGLKLLYPATPQEMFEALVAGFYDRNPCLVFEHKLLYWSISGNIDFSGDLASVWRPRRHLEGNELSVVAMGAMVHEAMAAAKQLGRSIDLWNPLVLQPLDLAPVIASVERTGRLLVVQECGITQGIADRIVSEIVRQAPRALRRPPQIVCGPDAPVPFAPELERSSRPGAVKIAAAMEQLLAAAHVAKDLPLGSRNDL